MHCKKKDCLKKYIIIKIILIIKKVKLINKKEFITIILNKNHKIFMVYIIYIIKK